MKKKILIVDDEAKISNLISFSLQDKGFETVSAESGERALEVLKDFTPELIVLDIMMPGINGIEVCKIIKSDEKTKDIKIILLSAKVKRQDEEEGLNAGADIYMTKPFRSKELMENINKLLGV